MNGQQGHGEEQAIGGREIRTGPGKPRVGFLGVGWIGLNRLNAIAAAELVQIAAVADLNAELAKGAVTVAPGAVALPCLDELLKLDLDGVVIATPTALHAEQSAAALSRGMAVFCQKPLGIDAEQTARLVQTAREQQRLLAVDLSYRHLRAVKKMKEIMSAREIGDVFAADLVFHNAYGPDKSWYYAPELSGGGCLIDLGIHLIDLALWMLDFPAVCGVSGRLFTAGRPIPRGQRALEDFASVQIDLAGGATLSVSCSWRLPAGRDADIRALFYGTRGALMLRNVKGSFYDFCAQHCVGTSRTVLDDAPDAWGGRAAVQWARQLCESGRYDPAIETSVQIAQVIDAIYDSRRSSKES
jgi:predicted dehydrogenase